ncbi:uncharacterized protein LOC127000780 [Eriocheir sinensis]|uniref:uncharacterized protein LOC127000780 n=1 Tax=Eriocheir sinensis TaxID=95602 RepID=UPI0021CA7D9A|nr:uncharacterized protein LOC127000780 [Eriocheir sinensis]XP_050720770.1 uncharacterized protein LOC127000780 [Eriocheir sinensis]XP_050720771.1 uncharacterized protein LOC127000780 [Eriocheir sinensis]XP_050720772.1 uncharacterized protein LOC127000780 [Eriocheir sinensis]XP_050720774.1 uncharacterized protein LOC127000780 [Eriocheir sinensis]
MDNSGVPTSAMGDAFIPWPNDDDFWKEVVDDSDPVAFGSKLMNYEMHFDNQKMTEEMTLQEPTPAVSSNLAVDNVMPDTGGPAAGPVTPSVRQHTPAFPDYSNFSQSEPVSLYGTNLSPQMLMPDQGHASSSSWAPPAPPQTALPMQVGVVAQRTPDMAAPHPQGAIDTSCPGSSTGGRKRKVTNASNGSKTTSVEKLKKWQLTTPCEDPDEERKRQNAIKSHNDRVKKNNEVKAMEKLILCLQQQFQELRQKYSLQEQELKKVRQELREEKQKNLTLKYEISSRNQEMMEQNQILNEFLQQAKLIG